LKAIFLEWERLLFCFKQKRRRKMGSINYVRVTIGIMIILGLVFFKPLAYLVGIMMIVAGVTGFCLLETLFTKLGIQGSSCSLKK
jgi:accessory gene regulator protein AgrB